MAMLEVSLDTQAVLLLTARFHKRADDSPQPLTHGEYNRLATALGGAGLRPADLLTDKGHAFITEAESHPLEPDRMHRLVQRSMALAIAMEAWGNAGLWVMSRADEQYPARLRERLRGKAPVLLFGCGDHSLLEAGGLAIVGSRTVDEEGAEFTRDAAAAAASEGIQVISGGARGVDSIAMEATLDRGGCVVGVLANDLAKLSRSITAQDAIADDRLCLASPFQPEARFEAWKAMDRNKVIYALSDWALVVASDLRKGGTWAGAKENLDAGWVPTFVRSFTDQPASHTALIDAGARPLTTEDLGSLVSSLQREPLVAREIPGQAAQDSQMNLF